MNFFYKVSYKNPSPALPILLADFIRLFSSIADFGRYLDLYYYDTNATHNITARLRAYYGTLSPAYIDIASVSSTGSAGYGFTYSAVNHTVNNDVQ